MTVLADVALLLALYTGYEYQGVAFCTKAYSAQGQSSDLEAVGWRRIFLYTYIFIRQMIETTAKPHRA